MGRRMSGAPLAAAVAAAMVLLATHLSAQAVCSAPHSSPTLNQSGDMGTLGPGAGWAQVSLYQQRSRDFFGPDGERRDFLADSEFLTRSVFLTGALGVLDGVELWVQAPVHRLTVESAGGGSQSTGLGDIRVAARLGPELVRRNLPLAIRLGLKVPGSDFPVDATVLPLSEGQVDGELSVESGHGFTDLPLYLVGWAGYRIRGENRDARRDPGDEVFAHAAVGGTIRFIAWELGSDWIWGAAPEAQGLELPGDKRRLFQLVPRVGVTVAGGRLELTSRIPVSGRNLPAGPGISLGYRLAWGFEEPDYPFPME